MQFVGEFLARDGGFVGVEGVRGVDGGEGFVVGGGHGGVWRFSCWRDGRRERGRERRGERYIAWRGRCELRGGGFFAADNTPTPLGRLVGLLVYRS